MLLVAAIICQGIGPILDSSKLPGFFVARNGCGLPGWSRNEDDGGVPQRSAAGR
jgi:hypothetical protein